MLAQTARCYGPIVKAADVLDAHEWQRSIDSFNESDVIGRESEAQTDVYYNASCTTFVLHDAGARCDTRDDSVFFV